MIVSSDEGTFAYTRTVSVDPGTQSEVVTYTSGFAVVDSGLDGTFWQFDPAQDFSGDITFNYTVTDGETDPVAASATLHVAEVPDAPVIEGDMSGSVTEDLSLTAHGTLTITDPDTGESSFQAATIEGQYGSLDIDSSGSWTYTVDNNLEAVQSLAAGQVLPDSIDVTSYDGTVQTIQITITGTNDGPVLSGPAPQATVSEDDSTFTFDLLSGVSDVDTTDTLSVDVSSITPVSGDASGIVINTDGTLSVDPNACLLYTSPSPRDGLLSRMPSSA